MHFLTPFLCFFFLAIGYSYSQSHSSFFVENKGQYQQNVLAKVDLPAGALFLENNKLTFNFVDHQVIKDAHDKLTPITTLKAHSYSWEFLDANLSKLSFSKELEGKHNYFLRGTNTSNVSRYEQSTYTDVYEGIDYRIYGFGSSLKYDWVVRKQADPSNIKLRLEGIDNARIDSDGRLIIKSSVNHIIEEAPFAYQMIDNEMIEVACRFKFKKNRLSFQFPDGYDKTYDLIIDPLMIFSTFSGSTSSNFGFTATNDDQGFLYAGGVAFAIGYPTTVGAYQTNYNGGVFGTDIVLTKYSQDGSSLIYSTYLGGSSDEVPHSLIVFESQLYMMGTTGSIDYPSTANSYDNTFNSGPPLAGGGIGINYNNGCDIVVSKFSEDGSQLLSSTFLGGSGNDGFNNAAVLRYNYADQIRGEIDIDELGNCYVASSTYSTDFPIVGGAIQPNNNGAQEGVIVKLDNDLTSIEWSSYWGGSGDDAIYSLSFNANEIYVSGGTTSNDMLTFNNSYAPNYLGGTSDAFIARLTIDGSSVLSSTYFGSSAYDQAYFIELDNEEDVYIFGQTLAPDLTLVSNANFSEPNSGQFVSKLTPDLTSQMFSTVFGSGSGQIDISPTAFLVDACNRVYCSGWGGNTNGVLNGGPGGSTSNLSTTFDAFQSTTDGSDFYLIILEDNGNTMSYGSFFGGNVSNEHVDGGTSRFDKQGIVYQSVCAGCGGNSDFPTTANAYSSTNNSTNCNNAVFKFDPEFPLTTANFEVTPFSCDPSITFDNLSLGGNNTYLWSFGDGQTSNEFNPTYTYQTEGIFNVTLYTNDPTSCNFIDSITKPVEIRFNLYEQANDITLCNQDNVEITGVALPGFDYEWSPAQNLLNVNDVSTTFFPDGSGDYTYYLVGIFENCQDTLVQNIVVESDISAAFSAPEVSCSSLVDFVNLSVSENTFTSFWQFGDGQTSTQEQVSNTYANLGTFIATLIITDSLSCNISDTTSLEIILRENIYLELATQNICVGDSVLLSAPSDQGFNYSWSPSTYLQDSTLANTVAYPLDTITYIRLGTAFNCNDTVTQTIRVSDVNLNYTPLLEYCSNEVYLIASSTDDADLYWSNSLSFINNQQTDSFLINTPGDYYVQVSANGCTRIGKVNARIVDDCCTADKIIVPNAFSPNGDLINDYFEIKDPELLIAEIDIMIYNRLGQMVFSSSDLNLKWDGYFKGSLLPSSVFDYYLKAQCTFSDQRFNSKGNITLVR
jgi:gliding motility-associated-like protein